MKLRFGSIGLALSYLICSAAIAAANAPPPPGYREPPKPTKQEVKLPVTVKTADLSAEGIQAKIVIPLALKPGDVPAPAAPNAAPRSGALIDPTQRSIVAAAALSLAAVSIVFVVRGKKLKASHKAAMVGVACMLGIFGAAQADIRVPGQPYNGPARRPDLPPRIPQPDKPQILIEYSPEATEVTLTVHGK